MFKRLDAFAATALQAHGVNLSIGVEWNGRANDDVQAKVYANKSISTRSHNEQTTNHSEALSNLSITTDSHIKLTKNQ